MMKKLIQKFPQQLEKAITIGQKATISVSSNSFNKIVIAGLGGSGIGGNLLQSFTRSTLSLPLYVNKDYSLPAFVDDETLVIISSYSGNTEETLSAFDEALQQEAQIICITSDGKVEQKAKKHRLDHILIPGGDPPRACLGYSIVQLLFILKAVGHLEETWIENLYSVISLLDEEQDDLQQKAAAIAPSIKTQLPIIYAGSDIEAVALRYRQQFNENADLLCWHHVIPEMNHNEINAWQTSYNQVAVLMLRKNSDPKRVEQRMDINKSMIKKHTAHFHEIWAKGRSMMEEAFYLIHFGDWLSYHLAEERHIDAIETDAIDHLKEQLG